LTHTTPAGRSKALDEVRTLVRELSGALDG
jgi:hypothetical protein